MQITIHLKDNYLVDVGFNIIKGLVIFGGLSAIFGTFIIAALFFFDDPLGSLAGEQHKWCEEHHPTLNFTACSLKAGW